MPTGPQYAKLSRPPAHVVDARRCWAHVTSGERQCQQFPIPGQRVCHYHGGSSPNAKAAGAKRVAEQRAQNFLQRIDHEPLADPLGELLRIASEAVAAKDYFSAQIEELRYKSQTGEQLRSEVALWERAMDRCVKTIETIVKLGLAERVTRVREAEVALLNEAMDRTFARMGLSKAQRAEAEVIVIEELEAISSDKTP